jgi:hypothetical protein
MKDLKSCVVTSRLWGGREVADELVAKARQTTGCPKLVLLFATVDYREEFGRILSGIGDAFPGVPLAGGTVAGFMNQDGFYTRGVTAFLLDYPNMDVAVGVGRNTKRNPGKAGSECAAQLAGLKQSRWKNGFLFTFVAGTEIPRMPGMEGGVIRSGAMTRLVSGGMGLFQYLMQKSVGREEEVLDEIVKEFPDFGLIHGSTIDNVKMSHNYQFHNGEVLTNSVVCLGVRTDLRFSSGFGHGAVPVTKFAITDLAGNDQLVRRINGNPAPAEFSRLLGKPEDLLFEGKYYIKRFPSFPFGMRQNDRMMLRAFVLVMKDSMLSLSRVREGDMYTLSISGRRMIDAVGETLSSLGSGPEFGVMVSCAIRLMTLGSDIEKEREKLLEFFGSRPFLSVYTAGECIREPGQEYYYMNESFAATVFRR